MGLWLCQGSQSYFPQPPCLLLSLQVALFFFILVLVSVFVWWWTLSVWNSRVWLSATLRSNIFLHTDMFLVTLFPKKLHLLYTYNLLYQICLARSGWITKHSSCVHCVFMWRLLKHLLQETMLNNEWLTTSSAIEPSMSWAGTDTLMLQTFPPMVLLHWSTVESTVVVHWKYKFASKSREEKRLAAHRCK